MTDVLVPAWVLFSVATVQAIGLLALAAASVDMAARLARLETAVRSQRAPTWTTPDLIEAGGE